MGHDTASYGPSNLPLATFHQMYDDIVRPDVAPHYTGSRSSSSGSSIAAIEDPYELGALVNMHAPTVSETTTVQLSSHQHQAASVPSALFPQNVNQFASTRAELDTSPANLLNLATAYGQPFSENMYEAFLQQEWRMPDRNTGLFAPEQPAGFSSSGADLYCAQDTRAPHLAASHIQPYDPRFLGYPGSRPVSDVHAERQREHTFAAGGFSGHDHRAHGQFSYNMTIPAQSSTLAREAPLRTAQAADLPLAYTMLHEAHHQGPALLPRMTHAGSSATCSADRASATYPLSEWHYGSSRGAARYHIPEHDPSMNGSSSRTLPQVAFAQWLNGPHASNLRKDDLRISPHLNQSSNP